MITIGGIRNWHYDVSLSTQLIENFVQGVEKQVAESIAIYRMKHADEGDPGLDDHTWHEAYQGLDGDTWHLPTVFEEYFPSLHRRSALLTLWGFAEYELHKLCLLYQSENHFQQSVFDMKGKGIDRSLNYLKKIADLKGLKASQNWVQFKALQEIRNAVTHNDGRLNGRDGKPKHTLLAAIKTVGLVNGHDELIFEQGFLANALNICSNYFTVIGTAIKKRDSERRTLTV